MFEVFSFFALGGISALLIRLCIVLETRLDTIVSILLKEEHDDAD